MAGRAAQLAIDVSENGASETAGGLDRVGSAAASMGDKVEAAGRSAEKGAAGLDRTAEGADEVASKGAQAAGAMGGLGELIGGPFGAAMQTGGIGLQAMADSGDLLNAALENSVVSSLRAKAATAAKTVADKASAVATRATTIAQKALNLAQRASPIGLIITGVLLLVGALILAYRNSAKFRAIVDGAMRVAKAGVDKAMGAFRALGPIVGKVAAFIGKVVTTYVGVYVKAFQLSLAVVKAVWSAIRGAVGDAVGAITGKAGTIREKLTDVWQTVQRVGVAAFKALTAPIQAIIDLVDRLLDAIKSIHVPHVDLNPFNNRSAGLPVLGRGGGGGASGATVVNIGVTIQGTATTQQADQFMRTVDQRLRALGKTPVFT